MLALKTSKIASAGCSDESLSSLRLRSTYGRIFDSIYSIILYKSVKEFMRSKFRDWYSEQVQHQLSEGKEMTPVDLKMSTMKPLGARWLVSLYDYITENGSVVENGFKAAGLLS